MDNRNGPEGLSCQGASWWLMRQAINQTNNIMRMHKSILALAESWPVTIHQTTFGRKSFGYDICLHPDHDNGDLVTPWRHDTGEEYTPVRLAAIEPSPGGRWRVMCHEVTRPGGELVRSGLSTYRDRLPQAVEVVKEHLMWVSAGLRVK